MLCLRLRILHPVFGTNLLGERRGVCCNYALMECVVEVMSEALTYLCM